MPDIVQDPEGNFLLDMTMVWEGLPRAFALNDGLAFMRFEGDSTLYIGIDDAIEWWENNDYKNNPVEDLRALKVKFDRGEVNCEM